MAAHFHPVPLLRMSGTTATLPCVASRSVQRQLYILQGVMTNTGAHMVHASRVILPRKQSKVGPLIFLGMFIKRKTPRCIEISKFSNQTKQHNIPEA